MPTLTAAPAAALGLTDTAPAASGVAAWEALADLAIAGDLATREQALDVLRADDTEILGILNAAYRVRRHHFSREVKLNMLINAKSGHCPEDCGYCSQSKVSNAPIDAYGMVGKDTILAGAEEAVARKASTYCIVCSGRGPTAKTLATVTDAVRDIKAVHPTLRICACLGILRDGQAEQLAEAGVDRYNHNINTSARNHDAITQTHSYDHRVKTVGKVKDAGISPCSGIIIGMGETDDDLVDMAVALRDLGAESIPVNFLVAIEGTPLQDRNDLSAMRCLKVLALFRFINPLAEIRVSGGREVHLRSLQPLALFPANSIFVGDYLTTAGQKFEDDHAIVRDLGFTFEGYES